MVPRHEALSHFRSTPQVSVLIVGGGVNGIGTFRDLALQGVDVLLVEAGDFCSGASAASSHMAHGGIRYLENGEFRLVREAVQERNRLLRNAPHLVKPLPTTIPIFKAFSGLFNAPLKFLGLLDRPAERGAVVIKLGLMMYDAYTGRQRRVPRHVVRSRRETQRVFPNIHPDVQWTATYYDGFMPMPERICIELLLDAEAANPQANALSYVSAVGASGGMVTLRDELTGETFDVQPQVVVNAAGPWIDFANSSFGKPTRFIGGTKGSHLVLDHPQLRAGIGDNEFFFENKDGRIVLILPYYDRVMVGTSDIPIENPNEARCTEAEVEYFLGMIDRVFPHMAVERSQIVFVFSGVRPLPASDARTTGQISRDHSIRTLEGDGLMFPVYSLVGGKWTSFRAFSEETADTVLQRLGRARRDSTESLPIGGGRDYPFEAAQHWIVNAANQTGLSEDRMAVLFERYGTRAKEIARTLGQGGDEPLQCAPTYLRGEIAYLAQHEKVLHLDDLGLRRTALGMQGRLSQPLIEELAKVAGVALGWSEAQQHEEVQRTLAVLADRHRVQ